MNLLRAENLTKVYSTQIALDNVDLELKAGQIVGLLGPNGSGKTTFIKLANGLLRPTTGRILIDKFEVGKETKAEVAYLPDKECLPDYMTVDQLIKFFSDFYSDFDVTGAREMIDNLNICRTVAIKKLSKGTREKVQLIMVMARDAKVYFLDEPIAGVDPAAREYILRTIIANYREHSTVVISTHLISDIETILDDVIFLKNGKITLHESADDLREREGKSVDELFREVFKC